MEAGQRERPARRAFVSVFVWLFVLGRVLVCGGRSPSHLFKTSTRPIVTPKTNPYFSVLNLQTEERIIVDEKL